MKSKRVLRFYFNAGALDKAMDNLILRFACVAAGAEGRGEYYAEKILGIIEAKDALAEFWRYLDGAARGLPCEDVGLLRFYAGLRTGISRLDEQKRKDVKRALIKFTRRARFAGRFAKAEAIVERFYCLL